VGRGPLSIPASGTIAAPATIGVSVSSVLSPTFKDYGAFSTVFDPALRALFLSNGLDFLYHVIDSTLLLTGPIAPKDAQTVASTATRATATLTVSGNFSDGDLIQVGRPGQIGNGFVTMKTTLDVSSNADQVKIGVSATASLQNIADFINGVGKQDDVWHLGRHFGTVPTGEDWPWAKENDVTSTSNTATTCVFRARSYGTDGNSYLAVKVIGANITSFGTGSRFTGGAVGTGTQPGTGRFKYAYQRVRAKDHAATGITDTPAELTQGTNCNVNQTVFTDGNARDGIDHHRWLRSATGGSEFHTGRELPIGTAEPYVDDLSDEAITENDPYDDSIHRPYTSGYPTRTRYQDFYKGSLCGVGAVIQQDYSAGTANVAVDSASVVLSADARPKVDWIGRSFFVSGDSEEYLIVEVAENTRTLTLNVPFKSAEVDGAAVSYVVRDTRDPCEVFYSVQLLPNNFPPSQSVQGIKTASIVGATGCRTAFDAFNVWTRTNLWAVTGEPDAAMTPDLVAEKCGAWSNESIVDARGILYWIGPNGVFRWVDGTKPVCISSPDPIGGQVFGIRGTLERLNADQADGICGYFDPVTETVRWYVPLDGEPYNNYCLVYNTQTGAFFDHTALAVTACEAIEVPGGQSVALVGDAFGNLFQNDVGDTDVATGDLVATVASYDANTKTITVSGTPYSGTATTYTGGSVVHIDAFGNPQIGKVASGTSSTLVLAWGLATAPVVGDRVIVGEIPLTLLSSRTHLGAPDLYKKCETVTLAFSPGSGGRAWVSTAKDSDDVETVILRSSGLSDHVDLDESDGEHVFWTRTPRGRRVQVEVFALGLGAHVELLAVMPNITTASPLVAETP